MATDPKQYLFPWQKRLIRDVAYSSHKYVVLEKSRRIGGTWAVSIAAVLYCLTTGHNCWFSSSDEKNAKEFIAYVRAYSEIHNLILGHVHIDPKLATSECVPLPNGSRISALSSNPKALRGLDGLCLLDEVALHEDQEELFRAAQGCVVQRGKLVLLSTHDGPTTLFFRLASEAAAGKADWSHHRVTLEDAVREGYAKRFAKGKTDAEFVESVRRNCLSEDAYGQEFLCKPLSLSALVSAEEYDRLALWPVPDELDQQKKYHDLIFGVDVGRTHDLTCFFCVERLENPKATEEHERYDYRTVCCKTIRNADFRTQHAILQPLIAHPSVVGGYIDQGAVGRALADAFVDECPDRVKAFSFTRSNKAEMAERLKGLIQQQRVSLPPDPTIREQFLSVRRTATDSGTLTYDGSGRDHHADAFWAASLAAQYAVVEAGGGVVVV